MSSLSIDKIETTSIRTAAAEIAALDSHLQSEATKLGAIIRELLAVCAATLARKVIHVRLEQDAHGNGTASTWAGIKFAGGRKQSHCGQGGCTYQWSLHGQSAYITTQGRIYLIAWDGEASDFGGCEGYMDKYTSEIDVDELESHLEDNPESAVEIVEALRKLAAEDKRARKTLVDEIAAVIARLH